MAEAFSSGRQLVRDGGSPAERDSSITIVGATGHRVLIVEPDEKLRWQFGRALERSGLSVLEAASGEDALKLISEISVAVVLLSDELPSEMSGIELLSKIRLLEGTETLPVILTTNRSSAAARVEGLHAGANDYLIKPVDVYELVARVRAQIRDQAAWRQVIERHLRERSAIAHALCQIRPEATPELTADVVCFELSLVRDLTSVALLGFSAEGRIATLAQQGPPLPGLEIGRPVSASTARYLFKRATGGPWIENMGDWHFAPSRAFGSEDEAPRSVAIAPMDLDDQLLGFLVLAADSRSGMTSNTAQEQTISAATDFARVAAGLLAPALQKRDRKQARRAGIDRALRQGDFESVFQPIVDLDTRNIVGYEVLTRFGDGALPEARFAEATLLGLGAELELATLRAAVDASKQLPDDAFISLNVSPSLILDTPELDHVIEEAGRTVVLELTEHDRIENYQAIRSSFDHLTADVRLSVDDAGSGFASLRHVLALNPDFVKLDHTWITGLNSDPARQALVAGLEYFASETGCRLIAEGIESEADLQACQKLDVEFGQGFLLGRPRPVEEISQ